jgi:hypothetical protein
MKVALYLETSQPCGRSYRIGFGCFIAPELVSMIFCIAARWF